MLRHINWSLKSLFRKMPTGSIVVLKKDFEQIPQLVNEGAPATIPKNTRGVVVGYFTLYYPYAELIVNFNDTVYGWQNVPPSIIKVVKNRRR